TVGFPPGSSPQGIVLASRAGSWISHLRDRRGLGCACLFTHRLPVIDRTLRAFDRSWWMLLKFIENYGHSLFELGIAASAARLPDPVRRRYPEKHPCSRHRTRPYRD